MVIIFAAMNEMDNVYHKLITELNQKKVTLIAVSKTKTIGAIEALYALGQRDFGENYVQEVVQKYEAMHRDIRWHFIGHLQTNKVKYIAPFIHAIHGVDSLKLLAEINKQAAKLDRTINCLLQVHIAKEETKFGFDDIELAAAMKQVSMYPNVHIRGLMGMASFSEDETLIRNEFQHLKMLFDKYTLTHADFNTLSMGMSGDYTIAIDEGSTMVRIGSMLFGARAKHN